MLLWTFYILAIVRLSSTIDELGEQVVQSSNSSSMQTANQPAIKLTYFNDSKGRNELTRLIFAVGNVPYHDELIPAKEYRELRSQNAIPWGQLPTLTLRVTNNEGKEEEEVHGQSCSIARYAAKLAKIYPEESSMDALRTDAVVDSWRDLLDLFYDTVFKRSVIGGNLQMFPRLPSERAGRLQAFLETELRQTLERYERLLSKNTGGQVCRESAIPFPSWADLAIFDVVKTMEGPLTTSQFQSVMEGKPTLTKLVDRIDSMEAIQQHLKKYPYKDLSFLFAVVPWWKRLLHAVLFPVLECFYGVKTLLAHYEAKKKNKN